MTCRGLQMLRRLLLLTVDDVHVERTARERDTILLALHVDSSLIYLRQNQLFRTTI